MDRLVDLAKDLPHQRVPPSHIRGIDEPYGYNAGTKALSCRDVVERARRMLDCDFIYRVVLSADGRVMDGMHRICKALLLGHANIEAVRFIHDPEPDFIGVHPDRLPY